MALLTVLLQLLSYHFQIPVPLLTCRSCTKYEYPLTSVPQISYGRSEFSLAKCKDRWKWLCNAWRGEFFLFLK